MGTPTPVRQIQKVQERRQQKVESLTFLVGKWHLIGVLLELFPLPRTISVNCRYSLAAVVTGQMTLKDCLIHKNLILEIATTARKKGKGPLVGVIYDELIRFAWPSCIAWAEHFVVSGMNGKTSPVKLLPPSLFSK